MGARREPDYAGAARSAVNAALEQQKESAKEIQARGETYETKREGSQAELSRLFGRTGPEALGLYEQRFAERIPALTEAYETKQQTFKPGILDLTSSTSSFNLLADVLRGTAGEYSRGISDASTQSAARLYEALANPVAGFEAIANRPAFSKLYDPTYMETAKKPPTVSSDVTSFKPLYTYNV
jgi:hypothetical protein